MRAAFCCLAGALLLIARSASALDAFEIQVYDGTANAPGTPGIELHANTVASGLRTSTPPELPPNHQTHLTLEPSFGVTRGWELGAYLQTTVRPDGSYDWSGVKLRSKLVRPGSDPLRLGVNLEIAYLPPAYDRDRWGAEIRPIVAYTAAGGRVLAAVNPIVDFSFAGDAPSFEPAATAVWVWPNVMSAGIELYADFGPIGSFPSLARQQHYLFEVVNVLTWKHVELNAGIGEGLTAASNDLIAKVILGYAAAP